jgi:INO80 complex subunit C
LGFEPKQHNQTMADTDKQKVSPPYIRSSSVSFHSRSFPTKLPFKKKGWKNQNVVLRGQQRTWPHLKQILASEETLEFSKGTTTYSSIEAAPSILPARKYCDITGLLVPFFFLFHFNFFCFWTRLWALQAPYTDPRTGLRFANAEVYRFIKEQLTEEGIEKYLSLRNAKPRTKLQ